MDARKKILIVDDDPVNLDFFQLMLSKLGFEVLEAHDGLDALERLNDFNPDIILLDNIMPNMSGWELTKTLKDDGRYRNIPIIMFSALDDVRDKVAGFELGVDDYITKPFNFSEVLARIKVILRTRELFAQIAMRESRLHLAEELNGEVSGTIADLRAGVNELISIAQGQGIADKVGKISALVEKLDDRFGRTFSEWDNLKKNEIGLSALESGVWNSSEEDGGSDAQTG